MEASGLRLRESFRVAVTGRARLLVGAASTTVDTTVLDLSTTGMGLATAVATPKPAVGEVCAFELLIDGARIEGGGVVVWSRRARPDRGDAPNVGIRFERLEGFAQREVATLVESRLAAGRWPSAAPVAAPSSAIAPVDTTERQLSLMVAGAAVLPEAAPAPARPEPPAGQAHTVQPSPQRAAPVAPVEAIAEAPRSSTGRGLIWIAIVALVLVLAFVVWRFARVEEGAEPGATSEVANASALAEEADEESAATAIETGAPAVARTDETVPSDHEGTRAAIGAAGGEAVPIEADAAVAASTEAAIVAAERSAADAGAPLSARARRLIALEPSVEGSTEILTLRFDAPFREADLFAALIGPDPPRYLLRLRGIERPWRPPDLEVGSPIVRRVRTGLHSTPRGPELHLVIDLTTRAVEHSWAIDGDSLRVRLVPLAGR